VHVFFSRFLLIKLDQILEDWRSKRVLDPQKVDDALEVLKTRNVGADNSPPPSPLVHAPARQEALPRDEIFKRIEADRERHKRLRERRWVQPIMHAPAHAAPLASSMPLTDDADGTEELAIDIEFENEWETTSDWNEDDDEAVTEENDLCYPRSTTRGEACEVPMVI
jgi:CTD kinase subunit gamma